MSLFCTYYSIHLHIGRFVWMKKIESDIRRGVLIDTSVNAEKSRQRERMVIIVDNDTICNSQFFYVIYFVLLGLIKEDWL